MNYSAQKLIDKILKHCAVNSISHDDLIYALLTLLRADMKAFNQKEHNLTDSDGVALVNVRLLEE